MDKIDVIVQSYNKPESLIYTLLSLKKYSGDWIDCIYIDDDQSKDGVVDFYYQSDFLERMNPIKIFVRVNDEKSGYSYTCMTKQAFSKKNLINKIQLLMHMPIGRLKFFKSSDNVRYQWGLNQSNKKYVLLIHDDIKFFDDVVALYLKEAELNSNLAIIGDLGGSKRCQFGPCFTKNCSPEKILNGFRPCKNWPITGKDKSIFHKLLGRRPRCCRINEWCCLIDTEKANIIKEKYGVYFGNYEGGGDVGTYWFEKIIKEGFDFTDPLPTKEKRLKYYLHWWQGYEGHSVWVNKDGIKQNYEFELVREKLLEDFDYSIGENK